MSRECSRCENWLDFSEFSRNQWLKGDGISQCMDCVSSTQRPVQCEVCSGWYNSDNALLQHMKTHPTCEHCDERFHSAASLINHKEAYHNICDVCGRDFNSPNALFQHSKIHVPRNESCPICGVQKFRNPANAVAHVESGYCGGCLGRDNARAQIYQFVSQHAPTLRVPMIEDGYGGRGVVPDRPYRCTHCNKSFASLSAQMNHEGDLHRNERQLQQLGW